MNRNELANALHEALCTSNHIDGCGYHYGSKWSQAEWLAKADRVLEVADAETAVAVAKAVAG